jgi:hypothetical protein
MFCRFIDCHVNVNFSPRCMRRIRNIMAKVEKGSSAKICAKLTKNQTLKKFFLRMKGSIINDTVNAHNRTIEVEDETLDSTVVDKPKKKKRKADEDSSSQQTGVAGNAIGKLRLELEKLKEEHQELKTDFKFKAGKMKLLEAAVMGLEHKMTTMRVR